MEFMPYVAGKDLPLTTCASLAMPTCVRHAEVSQYGFPVIIRHYKGHSNRGACANRPSGVAQSFITFYRPMVSHKHSQ